MQNSSQNNEWQHLPKIQDGGGGDEENSLKQAKGDATLETGMCHVVDSIGGQSVDSDWYHHLGDKLCQLVPVSSQQAGGRGKQRSGAPFPQHSTKRCVRLRLNISKQQHHGKGKRERTREREKERE